MKIFSTLLVAALVVLGLLTIQSFAQSNRAQATGGQSNRQDQEDTTFEYGTLTTQVFTDNGATNFELIWNAGVRDIVGRSNNSLTEARQRLSAQLGRSTGSRTNLSVLLSTLGQDRWQLVESSQTDAGTVRIFIRPNQ